MKLTNRGKVVSNKKMTFAESIYFPSIIQGMGITLKHMFKKMARFLILMKRSQEQKFGGGAMS